MVDLRWPDNGEVSRPPGNRWIAVKLLLLPRALATPLMTAEVQFLSEPDAFHGQTAADEEFSEHCRYVQMLDQLSKDIA